MFMRGVILGALSAAGALVVASSAQADGLAFDQNLAPPGVYYGSGNSNGHFTVDTEAGVEVALRAHRYQQDATSPVGSLYSFGLAATNDPTNSLSFDWSVNPNVGGSQVDLTGVSATLTIHDFANNNTQSFPADFFLLGNSTGPGAPGSYQNSERLSFSFVDLFYNATVNNTFSVNLTLTGVPSAGTISVNETIQQGAGFSAAPEPASWAMMLVGFGGLGAMLRRTRRTAAAATA
jgi:hypothetical protein